MSNVTKFTAPVNSWIVIGHKGTTCAPWLQGKTQKQLEDAGVIIGKGDYVIEQTAAPLDSIPLNHQPLYARVNAWVAKRCKGALVLPLAEAIKKGLANPVTFWCKGENGERSAPQTGFMPKGWTPAEKPPRTFAVLPSKEYPGGRIEPKTTANGINAYVVRKVTFTPSKSDDNGTETKGKAGKAQAKSGKAQAKAKGNKRVVLK